MTFNFKNEPSVASIHSLSNPLASLDRLVYAYGSFIDPLEILPKTTKNVQKEIFIQEALEKQNSKRFTGGIKIYKDAMDVLFANLDFFKNKKVIFLDFKNITHKTKDGFYHVAGVDDFSIQSELPFYLMKMYDEYLSISTSVSKAIENTVFWRLSPYDMPFMLGYDKEPFIYHPLEKELLKMIKPFQEKGKFALGNLRRSYSDIHSKKNYQFSPMMLSIQEFNKQEANLEFKYETASKKYVNLNLEEFSWINKKAIECNRALLKKKYQLILDELNIAPSVFMLQGDLGRKILSLEHVIGDGLLKGINQTLFGGSLEVQALNKLSGYFNARHAQGTSPFIFKKESTESPLEILNSWKNPGILSLGTLKELDGTIQNNLDKEDYALLREELKQYSFSISPIEVIIMRLNKENFLVDTDEGETMWRLLEKNKKIHPYNIVDIKRESEVFVRPSNTGSSCEVAKYISILKQDWNGMGGNKYSRVGNIIHQISNDLPSKSQINMLKQNGIKGIARNLYCEIPMVYQYTPTSEEWFNAEKNIFKKYELTNNDFYSHMLKKLDGERGITIFDAGHTDGALIIEEDDALVIVDFKRRMLTRKPPAYFYAQISRYALAIIQGKQLKADYFYAAMVQTPYHPAKFSNKKDFIDTGVYRNQPISIRKINLQGEFIKSVKEDLIIEYVGNKVLANDVSKGYLLRELYKNKKETEHPSCHRCFSNDEESQNYKCRTLLDGVEAAWD